MATPRNIGVYETSFQKRHQYATVILDKDQNTVLDVLQDRKAESLSAWLGSQETAELKGLESISMDMWDPFIKAVNEGFENWDSLVAFDQKAMEGTPFLDQQKQTRADGQSRQDD